VDGHKPVLRAVELVVVGRHEADPRILRRT
jgi:hypothetical protein